MAPTANQRKAAETLKAEGNALFSKGRYLPAAECYTEAITLVPMDPAFAALYVNRGMCYKKMERWQAVVEDAAAALSLDGTHMKAHYLMGCALREQQRLLDGISHLQKALESAREKGDSIKDEIWRELAKAKYAAWQQDSKQRTAAAAVLRQQLDALMLSWQWRPDCLQEDALGCKQQGQGEQQQQQQQQGQGQQGQQERGQPDLQSDLKQQVMQQWQALFARAAHLDVVQEVPSHLLCPLTMEVFRDPVITPSGFSYERSALLEHLSRVGKFDPISRTPLTVTDITANVGLRNATQHYLDEHPWAWHECV